MPLDYQPVAPPPAKRAWVRDDVAYILPMAAFLLLTHVGVTWPKLFPISYAIKGVAAAILLVICWRSYTRIRWNYAWLGAIMGVVGVVQWVGMEKLLLHVWPNYPRLSADVFDPTKAIESPLLLYGFLAVRWITPTLVVPIMEELFWRDFAWRSILAPNDFKLADVGEWDWKALAIVSLIFSAVHIQWMTAIVWGLMVGGLLIYTRSLGACIIMHGVTNFLLGGFVLYSHYGRGRDEWYFW